MINISQTDLNLIKTYIGYPQVTELLLTDDQIKDLIIEPTLKYEYFNRFPIENKAENSVDNSTTLKFPDDETFGVLDVRIVRKNYMGGTTGMNMVALLQSWAAMGGDMNLIHGIRVKNGKGVRYNPEQLGQIKYQNRFMTSSLMNTNSIRYDIDINKRQVTVYSMMSALVDVTWAKWSNNFDDVRQNRKLDVISLCGAKLQQHLCDLSLLNPKGGPSGIELDYSSLRERAKEISDKIYAKWAEYPVVILQKF